MPSSTLGNVNFSDLTNSFNANVNETLVMAQGWASSRVREAIDFLSSSIDPQSATFAAAGFVAVIVTIHTTFLSSRPIREVTGRRPAGYGYLAASYFVSKMLMLSALAHIPEIPDFDFSKAISSFIPILISSAFSVFLLDRLWRLTQRIHSIPTSFCRGWVELFANSYTVMMWIVMFHSLYSSNAFQSKLGELDNVIFAGTHVVEVFAKMYVFSMHSFLTIFVTTSLTLTLLCWVEFFWSRTLGRFAPLDIRFVSSGIPYSTRISYGDRKHPSIERAREMTSWYSLLIINTGLDMLLSALEFLGKSFVRPSQALKTRATTKSKNKNLADLGVYDLSAAKDVWFDWMADCGDGFNSSYQVARALAQPSLNVTLPTGGEKWAQKAKTAAKGANCRESDQGGAILLPRAKMLVIGGDLAYPNPTDANYENRFFYPFECALPPPPAYSKEHIAVKELDPPENLYSTEAPVCFAIPGNHDWYDSLANFHKKICHRNYLGGWKMPQMNTYFAVKLPNNWWFFALDNGLTDDVDLGQFDYFSAVIQHVGANDKVIIGTHEPAWLANASAAATGAGIVTGETVELLMKTLGKRVAVRIAGDIHHYSRYESTAGKSTYVQAKQLDGERVPAPVAQSTNCQWVVSGGGGAFMHPTHVWPEEIHAGPDFGCNAKCKVTFPERTVSRYMAWRNLFEFRRNNWLFDCMGALVYYLLVYSSISRVVCSPVHLILKAPSPVEAISSFVSLVGTLQMEAMSEMTASSITTILFCGLCCGFSGGVKWQTLTHFYVHWFAAIAIAINMGLSMYVGKLVGFVGESGHIYARLTMELDTSIQKCDTLVEDPVKFFDSLGFDTSAMPHILHQFSEPNFCSDALKTMLVFFEWPELAWELTRYCPLTPSTVVHHSVIFSWVFFAIYWMVASLTVSTIFSWYLALYGFFGTAHFDEPYSSLRCADYKNFVRFHIGQDGTLSAYTLGSRTVPKRWIRDPEWTADAIQNKRTKPPSFKWKRPSKFVDESKVGDKDAPDRDSIQLIDFFQVKRS